MKKEKIITLKIIRKLNKIRKKRELSEVEKLEYKALLETMPND